MKDEDIIALANECNAMELGGSYVFDLSDMHAFAKAIQDKQREEDAKICENMKPKIYRTELYYQECADAIRTNKD